MLLILRGRLQLSAISWFFVILAAFEYYPRDLNNAATSRILGNPAVISIFYKQLHIFSSIYLVLI